MLPKIAYTILPEVHKCYQPNSNSTKKKHRQIDRQVLLFLFLLWQINKTHQQQKQIVRNLFFFPRL